MSLTSSTPRSSPRSSGAALQDAVDAPLHADFEYDSLTYVFPYQVHLKNARISTDPELGDSDLLTIAELDLTLARLPLPNRPVVIESLDLKSPAIHVVRREKGIVGASGLQKTEEEIREHPPERPLSDMFEAAPICHLRRRDPL